MSVPLAAPEVAVLARSALTELQQQAAPTDLPAQPAAASSMGSQQPSGQPSAAKQQWRQQLQPAAGPRDRQHRQQQPQPLQRQKGQQPALQQRQPLGVAAAELPPQLPPSRPLAEFLSAAASAGSQQHSGEEAFRVLCQVRSLAVSFGSTGVRTLQTLVMTL